jgi:hypothetical protein
MWLKKHDTDARIRNVDSFRAAMATLSDGILPPPVTEPNVTSKRAVPTGIDVIARNSVARRRRVFLASLTTVPTTVAAIVFGSLSPFAMLLPITAFLGYVVWVREDMQRVALERRIASRNGGHAPVRVQQRQRSQLARAMATIRRNATARLLQEEPVLDTASTQSWQPAEVETAPTTFAMPDVVVPTYVTAPAATAIPRELDKKYGTWDADAMLGAADAQQRRSRDYQDMINQVEEMKDELGARRRAAADDIDRTDVIERVVGA